VALPFGMDSRLRAITYVIRSQRAGSEAFAKEVRQAVWASNPDLAVFDVRTMQDVYSKSLARTTFMLVLLAIAGATALFLAVVGIFGVISYVISQRSREIGIRLALGADPLAVKRMFVLRGLRIATIGIAAGFPAAVAFSRWMGSLLFAVKPLDLWTYIAVLGLVLVAAWLAAYFPARRAAALDPSETLRAE
jgi:ABC-type antimicrobial peptide transport system permease subunit